MSELYIRNWGKWQSYRSDRDQPPWIKIHRRLMRKPKWIALSDAQRGQLVAIWLLAADRNGSIPSDPELVKKLCYMNEAPDLNYFLEKRFLDAKATPIRRRPDVKVTHQTRLDKTRSDKKESGAKAPAIDREFHESFYPAYPHKVGKADALKSFRRARQRASLEDLIAGLERYKRSKPADRQWCNPATWLNQERWADEPAAVAAPPRRNGVASAGHYGGPRWVDVRYDYEQKYGKADALARFVEDQKAAAGGAKH